MRTEQEKGKRRDTDGNLLDLCVGETILPILIAANLGFQKNFHFLQDSLQTRLSPKP